MLVLDANILIRGVLGKKVRLLLTEYQEAVGFYAPATVFREAKEHIQDIVLERGGDPVLALGTLNGLWAYIVSLQPETYEAFESQARARLVRRDPDDWPILAAALALECAIWTEDRDFFGAGVATWTSDRVEIYLRGTTPAAIR
jgi:predicted nucleic acid-binding protein